MDDLQAYFAELYGRLPTAVRLIPRDAPGFVPVDNDCHANAARWRSLHEGDEIVAGWIIERFYGGDARLTAHSVVRSAKDGKLYDVTLSTAYDFLPHAGDDDSFIWVRSVCAATPIFHIRP